MEHARSPTTHLRQSLYRYVDCSSADDGDYGFEYFLPLDTPLKFAIVSPKEPDCTLGAIRRALRIIVCAEMRGDDIVQGLVLSVLQNLERLQKRLQGRCNSAEHVFAEEIPAHEIATESRAVRDYKPTTRNGDQLAWRYHRTCPHRFAHIYQV